MFFLALSISIHSCDEDRNETLISRNFSTESHQAGNDCLFCHQPNNDADGWLTAAGTVYDSTTLNISPNGLVRFFKQPRGVEDLLLTPLRNYLIINILNGKDGIF